MKKLCRGKKFDGCAPNRSRAKSGQHTDSGKNIPYYNVKAHRAVLVIEMLLIAAIMIFCFSILVGAIEMSYAEWESLWSRAGDDGKLNLGVLPDFLGGMSGILAGFLLEWGIFEKIKNLSKYETIISCLELEFKKIEDTLKGVRRTICEITLDDIVLHAENSNAIYNLPSYIIIRSKLGENILDSLQEIHGKIEKRNFALKDKSAECEPIRIEDEIKEYFKRKNPEAKVQKEKKALYYIAGEPYIEEDFEVKVCTGCSKGCSGGCKVAKNKDVSGIKECKCQKIENANEASNGNNTFAQSIKENFETKECRGCTKGCSGGCIKANEASDENNASNKSDAAKKTWAQDIIDSIIEFRKKTIKKYRK